MTRLIFITIHPQFVKGYAEFGVFRSAQSQKLAQIEALNLRDFAADRAKTIDDRPFGGGDGMVMRPDILKKALDTIQGNPYVIAPSPSGKPWTQSLAQETLCLERPLVFVCGRFAGIDQRFIDGFVDLEVSMGDFVVSGGELPSLLLADSMLRQIPGVLGHADSASHDSFGEALGGLLEYPLYTRPVVFNGVEVPPVLRGGDHKKIEAFRRSQMQEKTRQKRPDLLA